MWRMIILSHNMPLNYLDTFVDQEVGSIGLGGGATIPSARETATGLFCRLQETVAATASAIRKNGEILRSAQDDRKKARALYQEERRQQKEREKAFTQKLHQKFPR